MEMTLVLNFMEARDSIILMFTKDYLLMIWFTNQKLIILKKDSLQI